MIFKSIKLKILKAKVKRAESPERKKKVLKALNKKVELQQERELIIKKEKALLKRLAKAKQIKLTPTQRKALKDSLNQVAKRKAEYKKNFKDFKTGSKKVGLEVQRGLRFVTRNLASYVDKLDEGARDQEKARKTKTKKRSKVKKSNKKKK